MKSCITSAFLFFLLIDCAPRKIMNKENFDKSSSAQTNTSKVAQSNKTPIRRTTHGNPDNTGKGANDPKPPTLKEQGKNPLKADTTKNVTSQTNRLPEQKERLDSTQKKLTDNSFMVQASQFMVMQIRLGELAKLYGGNAAVRKFGEQSANEQQNANQRLKNIMAVNGVVLEDSLCEQCNAKHKELSSLLGERFDAVYVPLMISEHEKMIGLCREEFQRSNDAKLKAWAGQLMSTLKRQRSVLKPLQKKLPNIEVMNGY